MKLIKRGSSAINVGMLVLLLFPCSPSVLCIAPGHVAVEDLNSLCCASSGILLHPGDQSSAGMMNPSDCHSCTDLFLASNGSGILSKSGSLIPASPCHTDRLGAAVPDGGALLLQSGKIVRQAVQVPACSSVPLRC